MDMDRQQILDGIREHLAGRGLDPDIIKPESQLGNDLDLDSLDTVELTLGLEKRFGIEIPDEELEEIVTVDDTISLILKKTSVGA